MTVISNRGKVRFERVVRWVIYQVSLPNYICVYLCCSQWTLQFAISLPRQWVVCHVDNVDI